MNDPAVATSVIPAVTPSEIWTVADAADYLKMSVSQVRELCRSRSQARMDNPLPVLRIHSKAIRFRKSDVLAWVDKMAASKSVIQ